MEAEFSQQIFEKYIDSFMKICLVGAELFHADGQTDGQRETYKTKLMISFRNTEDASKHKSFNAVQCLSFIKINKHKNDIDGWENRCHIEFKIGGTYSKRLPWSGGSVLAFGTQVRGFKPGRSRRIFRAKKFSARLPSEGK